MNHSLNHSGVDVIHSIATIIFRYIQPRKWITSLKKVSVAVARIGLNSKIQVIEGIENDDRFDR
jgi:hypothetical protein